MSRIPESSVTLLWHRDGERLPKEPRHPAPESEHLPQGLGTLGCCGPWRRNTEVKLRQIALLPGPLCEPQYVGLFCKPGQKCTVAAVQPFCVSFTGIRQGFPSAGDRMGHNCGSTRCSQSIAPREVTESLRARAEADPLRLPGPPVHTGFPMEETLA